MTASIQPASGLPAWRLAVIGVVGVLAVAIGVAAGSFLIATRTAGVGAGASYVPASAPLYFEMRLDPSVAQDGALRELLGHFPAIEGVDLGRPLYAQMTERVDEMLAAEGIAASWSADVAPWFDGHIGLAVLEIPLDELAASTGDSLTPPIVVMLGVIDAAAADASIARFTSEADPAPTFTEQIHAGVTIRVAAADGAYALTDDQLLLAPSADDIITALDAHDSGSTTMAEVGEITRLTDALPADWLAFGIYDFSGLLSAAISQGASESPAMAEAFGALLESQPLRGALAVSAGGDRLAVDLVTDPPTGPFAVENAERGLAAEVPADTLYYTEAGNLGMTLAAVIRPMKDAVATVPDGAEQLAMVEAALGADLEDLVTWIDDGAMAFGFDGSEPFGGMLLVPNDMAAAERRLGQLGTFASLAALDPSSGISVEKAEVGATSVTTIHWEVPNATPDPMLPIPTALVVQYAVTNDRAIIGLGDSFVGRVLDLDAADALASVARFRESVDALGGASNAGVTWLDLTGVREAIETFLQPRLEAMDPGGLYQTEIRPWLLPLDRIMSVTRLEGDVHVQRGALLVR